MKRNILIAIDVILIFVAIKLICNQFYVVHYNYGNKLYKQEDYYGAANQYEKALQGKMSDNKECKIRINYALAICQTVELDESSQDSIEEAINTYELAIDVLTENNCDRDNEDAGQLKDDIQEEIDRLKSLQKSEEQGSNKDKEEKQTNKTENIEDKIQEIKENATKEQREIEKQYEGYNKEYNYDGKNW